MKFSLVNLGCKVNRVEADSLGAALLGLGWEHVETDADVAIVNTCTVTAEADRKTRKEVNRALERNPQAHVLVTGCAAAIDPQAYTSLSNRVEIVSKDKLVDVCCRLFPSHSNGASGNEVNASTVLRVGEGFPTRVGIKVQDGCDNACTFCIVHVARGKAHSMPLQRCIEEVRAYALAGVKEIVLTGIDLGAYDCDGIDLAGLVLRLQSVAPETRFRISSIEPNTISEALIEILASSDGMVCRHLHIPLQSGSSKVLHDMARRYTADEYAHRIAQLRKALPTLALSTDIIVGFPGESEDDFNQTLDMAKHCLFSKIHAFRYSARASTPAAEREDQIAPEVKAARAETLIQLAQELRRNDAASRIGTSERVLVEADGQGMTESYYPVVMSQSAKTGDLLLCKLSALEGDDTFRI